MSDVRARLILSAVTSGFRRGTSQAAGDATRLGKALRTAGQDGGRALGAGVEKGGDRAEDALDAAAGDATRLGKALRTAGQDGGRALGAGVEKGGDRARQPIRRIGELLDQVGRRGGRSIARGIERGARAGSKRLGGILKGIPLPGPLAALAGGAALGGALTAGATALMDKETRYKRLQIQSRSSEAEIEELRNMLYDTASADHIRVDPNELLAAGETVIERTGDMAFFRDNMETIAMAIQATGARGADVGGMVAEFLKLGIRDRDAVLQGIDTLTAQGKTGAFTTAAFAEVSPQLLSAFAAQYEGSGTVGLQEMGALAQVAMQATGKRDTAGTAAEALLRDLTGAGVVEDLQAAGVEVFDFDGNRRQLSAILPEIISAFDRDATKIGEIFTDEARRIMGRLSTKEGMESYRTFLGVQGDGSEIRGDSQLMADTNAARFEAVKTKASDKAQDMFAGAAMDFGSAVEDFVGGVASFFGDDDADGDQPDAVPSVGGHPRMRNANPNGHRSEGGVSLNLRRRFGRGAASNVVNNTTINVHSNVRDPEQMAQEVVMELERRETERRQRIDDTVVADPSAEVVY